MSLIDSIGTAIGNIGKSVVTANNSSKSSSSGSSSLPSAPVLTPYSGMSNDQYISSMTDKVNSLYDSQKTAQLQALQNARDAATANYQHSIDTADTQYAPLRDQAQQYGNRSLLANKELMAQQGLFNSGDNVTAQAQINNTTAGNINSLNTQKSQYVNNIQYQIDQLKANGVKDDANLIQQLEAAKSSALLDLAKSADSRSMQLYNMQNQLQQQNFSNQLNLSNAQNTLNQQNIDNTYRNNAFNYQQQRDQIGDTRYNTQFDYQKSRDNTSDSHWQQEYDRQGTWHDQAQALAQAQAAAKASRSFSGGSRGGGSAKYSSGSDLSQIDSFARNSSMDIGDRLKALDGLANDSSQSSRTRLDAQEYKQMLIDAMHYANV